MVDQQRRVRRTSCQNLAYPHGNTKLPRPTLDPGFWVLETNHGVHLRFDHARRERRIWSTISDLPTYELGPPSETEVAFEDRFRTYSDLSKYKSCQQECKWRGRHS
jgi:hypothetical protein